VEYGWYQDNTIGIAGWLADECSGACNPLISVINHEWGHTLGWDDFGSGCENSIMAHQRDRNTVIEPNSEDTCWMSYWLSYCEQGDDPKECRPYAPLPLFEAAPQSTPGTALVGTTTAEPAVCLLRLGR
jgi:hypothetical protein